MKCTYCILVLAATGAVIAAGQASDGIRVLRPNEIPPSVSTRRPDQKRILGTIVNTLGWKVGVSANAFGGLTFTEAAVKADAVGLAFIEGVSTQRLSPEIPKSLDYNLSADDVTTVRYKLLELRMGMPAYRISAIPEDEKSRRKLFEFARELGVETIISNSTPSSLAELDTLANEFGVNVALALHNPKDALEAIVGRSKRIGVSVDSGEWMENGIRTVDGLALIKDRLMAMNLRDRSALGASARNVTLGMGIADLPRILAEIGKLEPPVEFTWPMSCGDCSTPKPNAHPVFFTLDPAGSPDAAGYVNESGRAFEKAVRPAQGRRVIEISKKTPVTKTDGVPIDERQMIEAALPRQALAMPKKPRKLLVLDLCVVAFYHTTIAHANLAVELMGKNTGAYETVFSNDLDNLKYPKIKEYDAIFFNSVGGAVFADPDVLNGLTRYVREGGGVVGFHGTSFASQDLPEFGELMGAQDGAHQYNGEPGALKIDDPESPLTRYFKTTEFPWYDEFYHFGPAQPYSREKLHVLMSVDTAHSDRRRWHVRPDDDYGMVWVRTYGNGRVFNCALGHRPSFFANPSFAEMMLGAIQFALGDLEVDTTPSARLTRKQ